MYTIHIYIFNDTVFVYVGGWGGETQKRAYKIDLFTQTRTFIDLQSLSLN